MLALITSVLDIQVAATAQSIVDVQVTTVLTQACKDQVMDEVKPFKIQKIKVPSSLSPTIDLTNSDIEEEVLPSMLITEEVDEYL